MNSKKTAKTVKSIRNGRVYVGAWIDKNVVDKAREEAKNDKRTLASYIEMAISNHNDFWNNNPK